MCRAIDIASYILSEKGRLSGYQLQKLLYYSQAWCLVTQDRPLFAEQVRAWEHSPVVYEVAHAHRGRRTVVASDIDGNPQALSAEDQAIVEAALESYSQLSGDELEALSHSEEPWAKVYNGQTGLALAVISQESMRDYYASLMSGDARVAAQHHVPSFSISPRLYVSDDDFSWLDSILQVPMDGYP